jgi:hypothetical protein
MMFMPVPANASATHRPIPLVEPVTIAFFPRNAIVSFDGPILIARFYWEGFAIGYDVGTAKPPSSSRDKLSWNCIGNSGYWRP